MNPSWVSQPVPRMGAIKAEGIMNQLGRPTVDRLTVLVREAAQNSWDAADRSQSGPVNFGLDLRRLPDDSRPNGARSCRSAHPRLMICR